MWKNRGVRALENRGFKAPKMKETINMSKGVRKRGLTFLHELSVAPDRDNF